MAKFFIILKRFMSVNRDYIPAVMAALFSLWGIRGLGHTLIIRQEI